MKKKMAVAGSLLAAMFVLGAPAHAGVIFMEGNNPQADEQNILFNGPGTVVGPAKIVKGRTNQTSTIVAFESDENLVTPAGGQARVEAADGAFRLLTVYLQDGGTFGDLIFNLNTPNRLTGNAHITVNLLGGGTQAFDLGVDNGQNFLTILATDTDRILSVNINSNIGLQAIDIDDGRQFRISGIQEKPVPVPEPGTLALFAAGLIGIQRLRRKYNK